MKERELLEQDSSSQASRKEGWLSVIIVHYMYTALSMNKECEKRVLSLSIIIKAEDNGRSQYHIGSSTGVLTIQEDTLTPKTRFNAFNRLQDAS